MNMFESKVIRSFRVVKQDILGLKDQLLKLAENQEKIEAVLEELKNEVSVKKTAKKKITKKKR